MPVVVSFEGTDARDGAEFWYEACTGTFVGVEVDATSGEPLEGSVRAHDLGELVVGEIDASPQRMIRTPRLIDRADQQYLLLTMPGRGSGCVAQAGRRALVRPGDAALVESHRPFELGFDEAFDLWVFAFPRDLVRLGERDRARLSARRVDLRSGLAGVAGRALLDLARHGEQLGDPSDGGALALANDLLTTLLHVPLAEDRRLADALHRTLPLRIRDHVNQRLADPALSPARVAAAFGISVRYLHKLFEGEDVTVAHYIRERRLERCRLRLLDPRYSHQSIATLAFEAGFGDLSGFNRAFRARYGLSPRTLRRRGGVPAPRRGRDLGAPAPGPTALLPAPRSG
ncbi:helix-turn-helix domain-containing protein [Actinomycetospora sp. TBRC 11914]|uniref:AraC-like ligand-binding domain-containing protein n=1 Tax=Actinomycetospora sp. TBRC 11914 TaxID=2729387 RepID=UPI00145F1EF0|nr:helix-turn-helix domain-containing protein [Actinomycetospora sp. TBRC 11914]NMO93069.1 helix-turn-helix domain-containing protein [Actinomycetospora sp. TBRC 11914]